MGGLGIMLSCYLRNRVILSYTYKFMSGYLYFPKKLQNLFPINGNSFQRKPKLIATPYILQ